LEQGFQYGFFIATLKEVGIVTKYSCLQEHKVRLSTKKIKIFEKILDKNHLLCDIRFNT